MKRIIDVKYAQADPKNITESSTNLDLQYRNELYTILNKYESLFDGNIVTRHGKPYDIKIKSYAEPYNRKYFPVPLIHELTFKQ